MVVGGGNTAVEEALYLSHLASKVTLVHRRDAFRAEKILQDRLFRQPNVERRLEQRGRGDLRPRGPAGLGRPIVRLKNLETGHVSELQTDGVFIAIGHKPSTELFVGQLDMKPGGYLQTAPDSTATNVPGVFAAGDVTDDVFRQAVTAAGLGCMAALEAERYLAAPAGNPPGGRVAAAGAARPSWAD